MSAFDQRGGDRAERCDRQELSGQVEFALRRTRGFAGIAPGQPETGQTDRQVDQKNRTPPVQRDEAAADQGSCGQRETRTGRPGPDRTAAFAVASLLALLALATLVLKQLVGWRMRGSAAA